MSFMEQQIEFGDWYELDTPNGTFFVDASLVGDIDVTLLGFTPEIESSDPPGSWVSITYPNGDFPIPDELKDYVEANSAYSIRRLRGYGARLSAPGYMDCTEWAVFDTEKEAQEYLDEYYPDDESSESGDSEESDED